MLSNFVTTIANPQKEDSLSVKFREKRFSLFKNLVRSVDLPLKIIDVGGRETIWKKQGFCESNRTNVKIVILNIEETKITQPNIEAVVGDAKNMQRFSNSEFDIVFSNSVIEHVGDYEDQRQMANEIKRIGKRYFLQTPNRYFPIEPHFLFPFFQFLPIWLKIWLVTHFNLGWRKKVSDRQKAMNLVNSVRLLTKKELMDLFPGATLFEEKFFGLTKSFVVYDGWNARLE